MINKTFLAIGLVVAQLAVPTQMIAQQENILRNGAQIKLKTAPVDPYDMFRGRYVWLRMEENFVSFPSKEKVERNQTVYILFQEDADGFAKAVSAQLERPQQGVYIKAKASWKKNSTNQLNFNLPIDRYYMNEDKAPRAEQIYRENSRRDKHDAYVIVRVLNGTPLIEGLYVGDKLIEDYL